MQKLAIPDADIIFFQHFVAQKEATTYFKKLYHQITWTQEDIVVFGKKYKQPRLTALYGTTKNTYSYSGIVMHPKPLTQLLKKIYNQITAFCQSEFNVVLLNLYRDGRDSNGWHADNEKELGINPVIASLSLGSSRRFKLRHTKDKTLKHQLELNHGSLLLMKGQTQNKWQHQIPKTNRMVGPRINLTFRKIV